jgi:alpha/beta superfamily hydrolase
VGDPTVIGAHTILPAQREPITLHTADGVSLVGELALPPDGLPPVATLILLHPLPTHGGSMDSHVYRKAAWRLPALAQLAVLRFNTRGTASALGTSGGQFAGGSAEKADVDAAIAFALGRGLTNLWLVGWSFGSELALMYGANAPVVGAIAVSPPLRRARTDHLVQWAASRKPLTAIVPERDDFLTPPEARARFALVPQARVVEGKDAVHLWIGEKAVRTVLTEVVNVVRPGFGPLPTTWQGPSQTYSRHPKEKP